MNSIFKNNLIIALEGLLHYILVQIKFEIVSLTPAGHRPQIVVVLPSVAHINRMR